MRDASVSFLGPESVSFFCGRRDGRLFFFLLSSPLARYGFRGMRELRWYAAEFFSERGGIRRKDFLCGDRFRTVIRCSSVPKLSENRFAKNSQDR